MLKILNSAPNASPQKIDRLFYQVRIDEGIPIAEVFLISWRDLIIDLKENAFVEKDEKSLTPKGVSYLLKHK